MKFNIILFLAISFLSGRFATAQETSRPTDVLIPEPVLKAYRMKYSRTPVRDWDWEADMNLYEAEFMYKGLEYEAFFSPEGTWVKTIIELKKADVPAAVSKALRAGEFGSWKASHYRQLEMPGKPSVFMVRVEKGREVYFLTFDDAGEMTEKISKAEKKAAAKSNKPATSSKTRQK